MGVDDIGKVLSIKLFVNRIKGTGMRDRGGRGAGEHIDGSISFTEHQLKKSKFHEARQKDNEEVVATGTAMLDELQLMATIASEVSCDWLFGTGSEAAHFRAENSRAAAGLPYCCLDAEQRIMKRVEAASHLLYTPMPPMMDIVKATMVAIPSTTSSSTTVVVGNLDAKVSSSTPPFPSIDAPSTSTIDPPLPLPLPDL
ncbi:hypothetical protein M9H77_03212 [Catharanthus roseus]|uniref:Uncharacterized protein n=1 Tax=Catharanthus roseus TaxID=4058 RepID=A0ACC0CAR8_CATRO|nr:hypothetical protein M9H77_03212 [Catharanthus roseus]